MGMVDFCVNSVINGPNDISDYVLQLAFDNPISGRGYPDWGDMENDSDYSVYSGIKEKVIYKMIAPLLNVAGGVTELIPLSAAKIVNLPNGFIHVNVPDTLTGGRDILSIITLYPGAMGLSTIYSGSGGATCGNGSINDSLNSVVSGLSGSAASGISGFNQTTMTGRNSFLVRMTGTMVFDLVAKVLLSFDDEFSTLNPRSYPYFYELTVLGTKAYIYKHCRRGLKESVHRFGVPLDDIQDEIDSYRDSSREFLEYYNNHIKKVLMYNDKKGRDDYIAMITPRRMGR